MLEAAALVVLGGMFAWLAIHWAALPESVPRHYNAAGEPNAWGSKEGMWLLPLVAAGLYALISLVGRMPNLWNLPAGVDRNISEVQAVVLRLLAVVKLGVVAAFAYISWTGISVARGASEGLGAIFLPVVLAVTVLPAVYYWRKVQRLRQ
jgi:uncharacterized membrane protein